MKFSLASTLLSCSALAATASAVVFPTKPCPVNGTLPPNYVKPGLIVQVSKRFPDVAFGATTFPLVTPNDFAAVITLDLPPSAYNKICRLVVLFPDHDQTINPFIFSGPGHFNFSGYAVGAKADARKTTYNNQPASGPSPPNTPPVIKPGNAYIIASLPCGLPPGLTSPVTVGGLFSSADTTFGFYQSDLKCPLGFFVELLDSQ